MTRASRFTYLSLVSYRFKGFSRAPAPRTKGKPFVGSSPSFQALEIKRAGKRRKGLADAVARCAAGDVLVAWKIDRLGRSTLDLVRLVEKLKGRGVGLKVL